MYRQIGRQRCLENKPAIVIELIAYANIERTNIFFCLQISESSNGHGFVARHDVAATHALESKTGSAMDFGSGLVFSKSPSIGSTSRKNAK